MRTDRLDFVTPVFETEHPTIREGEETLTVLWFEYHARILGAKRGLPLTPDNIRALTYEAEEAFPPPHSIDFRMSVDRAHRYRDTK